MKQLKEVSERMAKSVSLKLFIVSVLVLLMLIPMGMIKSLIRERETTSKEVISEVSDSWGREQKIIGPYITVPYKTYEKVDEKLFEYVNYAHFLPEDLSMNGTILPETRKRGIYKVVVYESSFTIKGKFSPIDFSFTRANPEDIIWDEATINMGVSDMRGIQEAIVLESVKTNVELNPGIKTQDLVNEGVSAKINLTEGEEFVFNLDIKINGSENLYFVPLGKETNVTMNSTWAHPSFNGVFLPRDHTISEDGFTANWKVLHLNRPFPQQWSGKKFKVTGSAFGVSLIIPVDHYQKSFRSAKYAIMFIALTFITFFFIEIFNKKQIHAIHYLLVGFALVVFYSLLVSLSEHISFDLSYLISSVAIVTLITSFGAGIFKNRKQTLVLLSVLIVLYTFLFTILQLMEYSLLMGNIGLFVVLAIVMFFARKIKWSRN